MALLLQNSSFVDFMSVIIIMNNALLCLIMCNLDRLTDKYVFWNFFKFYTGE